MGNERIGLSDACAVCVAEYVWDCVELFLRIALRHGLCISVGIRHALYLTDGLSHVNNLADLVCVHQRVRYNLHQRHAQSFGLDGVVADSVSEPVRDRDSLYQRVRLRHGLYVAGWVEHVDCHANDFSDFLEPVVLVRDELELQDSQSDGLDDVFAVGVGESVWDRVGLLFRDGLRDTLRVAVRVKHALAVADDLFDSVVLADCVGVLLLIIIEPQ